MRGNENRRRCRRAVLIKCRYRMKYVSGLLASKVVRNLWRRLHLRLYKRPRLMRGGCQGALDLPRGRDSEVQSLACVSALASWSSQCSSSSEICFLAASAAWSASFRHARMCEELLVRYSTDSVTIDERFNDDGL